MIRFPISRRTARPLLAAALAALAALAPAAGQARHPNWLMTVTVSDTGSHVLGDPAAKVRVTEWLSYTCPHCAAFQRASEAPLRIAYVQPGKVSVEVRHLVRDPVDMTVAMLTNCGDPVKFFRNHSIFMQTQGTWLKAAADATPSRTHRWSNGPMRERFRAIANDLGFYAIMERRGYNRTTADRCLSDEAMTRRLAAERQAAINAGIQGTPSFVLNGTLQPEIHDWPALETAIKALLPVG